jgi:hypothetical protein
MAATYRGGRHPGLSLASALIDQHARRVADPPPPARQPMRPRRPDSKRDKKRALMEAARRAGWTGKTYKSAKQFERELERREVADGRH